MRPDQAPAIHLKDYQKPDYWVKTVSLDFSLSPESTIVVNKMVLERGENVAGGTPLILDGDEVKLESVEVNGQMLERAQYVLTDTSLTLLTPPHDTRLEVVIVTRLNPQANTKLMGLYRSSGNYCTQCEAEGFRRITFFPDRPDILAVYTTRIEADEADCPVLLGNGNPVETGTAGNGRHFAIWHDPHPKPSYLFALVAGDLGSIHADFTTCSGKAVKLGIYVEKGKEARAEYAMDALIRSMRWDEEVFGCEYDLDVFNIVAVSDFNMGAMENKGLNIFNDKYVLADPQTANDMDFENIEAIIAHEYFHNWTGNRITCRDWFQLCLKEGLTVYRDQEFSADQRSRAVVRIAEVRKLKTSQFPEDAGPLAHPVRPETYREINNFYTATVYEKGAEVVRMFKTMLGEETFFNGISLYLKRHDGEAATIEDFIACFAEASGKDLSQFALWYSQAGTPEVSVNVQFNETQGILELALEQSLKPTPGQSEKLPMHIPLRIGLIDSEGREITPSFTANIEHDASPAGDSVFQFNKPEARIVYTGLKSRPVVSINRNFSAPIRLKMDQTAEDLAHLAAHDSDLFNRAQALEDYAMRLLLAGAKAIAAGNAPLWDDAFLEAVQKTACDNTLEPAFRALAISLPGEADVAQAWGVDVDPDAIFTAIDLLNAEIGKRIEPHRAEIVSILGNSGAFSPDAASAGRRALTNKLLALGVQAGSEAARTDSLAQFENADNFTDQYAALVRIVRNHGSSSERDMALSKFFEAYKDNHIVLDKWFGVQAMVPGEDAPARIRQLMKHPLFSLENPNRARSVIGSFAMGNATGFNAASGEGYKLVSEIIAKLDAINPQVAARMLTAFRSFRSLEPKRRQLALGALEQLASTSKLSRDVSDILDRTLESQ